MATVRIMSYNIRSLRDDRAAVVRVIRDVDPDVVCIQEAPRFFRWRAKCARLRCATAPRSLTQILLPRFSSMNARTRTICQSANASGLEPLAPELRSISDSRMDDAVTSDALAASRLRSSSRRAVSMSFAKPFAK